MLESLRVETAVDRDVPRLAKLLRHPETDIAAAALARAGAILGDAWLPPVPWDASEDTGEIFSRHLEGWWEKNGPVLRWLVAEDRFGE